MKNKPAIEIITERRFYPAGRELTTDALIRITPPALVGHSERRARAEIALRPGHRLWLLELPRASLRRHWAEGEVDPLMALHPLEEDSTVVDAGEGAGVLWQDTGEETVASPADAQDDGDDGAWEEIEEVAAAYWAIPPDHSIFAPGDDRDDGEIAEQLHEGPGFAFGEAWNYLVSDRRRASLLLLCRISQR